MGKPSPYSAEVRDRAVRMVREHEHEYRSRWEAIRSVASEIGCTPQTVKSWVRNSAPAQVAVASDQARLKQLERENAELRRSNEILRKATRFFVSAELDRSGK